MCEIESQKMKVYTYTKYMIIMYKGFGLLKAINSDLLSETSWMPILTWRTVPFLALASTFEDKVDNFVIS